MPEMLSKAIRIASQAHEGQFDKANNPYILHSLRVSMNVGSNKSLMAAAVLHDVVEDTLWTLQDIKDEGFCEEVLDAVDSMTRREGNETTNREDYHEEFIPRLMKNDFAVIIKMADLTDNSSDERLVNLPEETMQRFLKKYARTRYVLMQRYIESCKKVYGGVCNGSKFIFGS